MGKYIAKRIGYMALVFLIVSFLMYSLYNLIPTDPARAELEAQKQSLKPAEYEQLYQELRAKMGLDDPLVIRYMRWMGLWPDVGDNTGFNGLLQGNFGYSQFYKKDVTEVIVDPMKNTIFINISPPFWRWASPSRWAFSAPFTRARRWITRCRL